MKANRTLLVVTVALLALSAYTYRASVQRADRFDRGQKLLPSLNVDQVAEITLTKGDAKTHLKRDHERFLVASAQGYPARNEAVNRFLRDILDIQLEKRVGRGEELEKELGVVPGADGSTEVVLADAAGKEMVHLMIGKTQDDGNGVFVRRIDQEDAPILLTSSRLYLTTGDDDFLDKEILDLPQAKIAAVEGQGVRLENQEGVLEAVDAPRGKKAKPAKLNQLRNILSPLRFTKHYLAQDETVQSLRFDSATRVELPDDSGYEIQLAKQGDKHYMRIRAYHNTQQLSIAVDADEAEAKEKADVLARIDEVQKFNQFQGAWVYEITDVTAERIEVTPAEMWVDA